MAAINVHRPNRYSSGDSQCSSLHNCWLPVYCTSTNWTWSVGIFPVIIGRGKVDDIRRFRWDFSVSIVWVDIGSQVGMTVWLNWFVIVCLFMRQGKSELVSTSIHLGNSFLFRGLRTFFDIAIAFFMSKYFVVTNSTLIPLLCDTISAACQVIPMFISIEKFMCIR